MAKRIVGFTLILVLLVALFSSASAVPPPAKIVGGIVSNVLTALFKWLWSLSVKSTSSTASKSSISSSSRSMMKFEDGYTVETVFDGSKLGIEPHSVVVSPTGELLVLDSANSNVYKISAPLSRYSRPKLIVGSTEGYSGHVDGRPRDARMNQPKGITVDDRGNIYIADTMNMAIRKINDEGVTTIAGGKWSRGGGHVDGPSEDAKFSNDFDVLYIASSCSLLVIDRGNMAIREIQLHFDDCSYQDDSYNFHLGIAVLVAAAFFGYMLALLHYRIKALFSSRNDPNHQMKVEAACAPYQRQYKSIRPPLIPSEDEPDRPEGFFSSMGRLFLNTGSTMAEIFGTLFSGFRRKQYEDILRHQHNQQLQQQQLYQSRKQINTWPMQESYVIGDEDEPPPLETRAPTPKKAYPSMSKDLDKAHQFKQNRSLHNNWEREHQPAQQKHLHHQRQLESNPKIYYEESRETNEIVFGAVQEQDGRRETMVIKAVDYGDPDYNRQNLRPRYSYMGYSHGY